jgi:hypothetical protein
MPLHDHDHDHDEVRLVTSCSRTDRPDLAPRPPLATLSDRSHRPSRRFVDDVTRLTIAYECQKLMESLPS